MEAQFTANVVIETLLVLLTGTLAVVCGIAALATRVPSAAWRRTLWQVSTLALLLLVAGETLGLGVAVVHSVRAVFSRAGQLAVREASDLPSSGTLATCPTAVQAQPGTTAVEGTSSTVAVHLPVSEAHPGDVLDSSVAVLTAEPAAPGPASSVIALRWEMWFLAVWCTGCVAMTWRLGCRRLRLWLLTRRSQPVGQPRWPESLPQLASQLGVRRRLRVIESDSFPTPATFGVLHPTIVLPVTFSAQYDQRQQRAVLAHEVAHLAAGDALWMCLADAVCVMLWWHVLSWWSRAKLREACECAADEGSLIFPEGPETLAECLVVVGRRLADRNKLAWLSIEGSAFRSHLGRRVEHLLRLPRHSPPRTGSYPHTLTKIALVMVLVFTTFLTTAWIRSQAVPNRGESNVNVLKLSWRRSLAAAVVVPFLVSLSQDTRSADPAKETSPAPAAAQDSPQEQGEGERPARQRVQRALRELEERAAAIENQLRELGDRHPDKAAELKRELNGVHEHMHRLRERDGAQEPGNIEGAMRELQERISATERQLQEAGGEQTDKGAAIHRELNGMRERMQQLRRRAAAERTTAGAGRNPRTSGACRCNRG